jgi:hypothetical protein
MYDGNDARKKADIRKCAGILKAKGRFALQLGSMIREADLARYAETYGL